MKSPCYYDAVPDGMTQAWKVTFPNGNFKIYPTIDLAYKFVTNETILERVFVSLTFNFQYD